MTPEGYRVLQAVAWSERLGRGPALPLKRIATQTLGGNGDLAARVLADLDGEGWVHTDTMGWQSGWLTAKGRGAVLESAD
jgi:hypothetical protein